MTSRSCSIELTKLQSHLLHSLHSAPDPTSLEEYSNDGFTNLQISPSSVKSNQGDIVTASDQKKDVKTPVKRNDFVSSVGRCDVHHDTTSSSTSRVCVSSPRKTDPSAITVQYTSNKAAKMESQISDDATQPISQSVYTNLIRSRIENNDQQDGIAEVNEAIVPQEDAHNGYTQFTCIEGDTGFLDLVSSLPMPDKPSQPFAVDISPTQTLAILTQFPESQRFKTPATAGKKREYNGKIIETTPVSQNPLNRTDRNDMANLLGLSQAFAATQAVSSPALALPTSALRSDRPSPQIGLLTEPQRLQTSSPLQLLHSTKQFSTEPAVHYVSVNGSQHFDGDLQGDLRADPKANSSIDLDEDSDHEPLEMFEKRREKMRNNQARQQIRHASSPLLLDTTRIGNDGRLRQTRSVTPGPVIIRSGSLPSSPPYFDNKKMDTVLNQTTDDILNSVGIEGISETVGLDPSNSSILTKTSRKKVGMTLVPDTTRKVSRKDGHSSPEIVVSSWPHSSRQVSEGRILRSRRRLPVNMDGFRDCGAPGEAMGENVDLNFSLESVDRISASPEPPYEQQRHPNQSAISDNNKIVFDPLLNRRSATNIPNSHFAQHYPPNLESVILETSSVRIKKDARHHSDAPLSRSQLETTITPVAEELHSTPSSPEHNEPARATRSGRKRRRIMEVSQDTAPLVASQSSVFDAANALTLDTNPEYAKVFANVQDELDSDPVVPQRRRRVIGNSAALVPVPLKEHVMQSEASEPRKDAEKGKSLRVKQFPSGSTPQILYSSPFISVAEELPLDTHFQSSTIQLDANSNVKTNIFPKATDPPSSSPVKPRSRSYRRTRRIPRKSWETHVQLQTKSDNTASPQSGKSASKNQDFSTGGTPSADISLTPTAHPSMITAPSMIFAYYMGRTRAYYPAVCLGLTEDGQEYKIRWPGYEPENLAGHGICSLDVRIGDEVKVDRDGFPKTTFVIRRLEKTSEDAEDGLTDVYGNNRAKVVPKKRKLLPNRLIIKEESVPISSLYIDLAMWNRISKRPSLYQQQPQADKDLLCTPVAHTSTPSTSSCRSRKLTKELVGQSAIVKGIFSGMVFALTFELEVIRDKISKMIQDNGGIVLAESFADLFDHEFTLRSEYSSTGFTALITDRHSRKGKYMQALSLGMPCLNNRWIEASLKDHSRLNDWTDYLLPAGECAELGGAIRSRILPPMNVMKTKLCDNFISRKSFFGQAQIIFVMGKWKTEKRKEQRGLHLFFVQAMNPLGNVQTVPDLDTAMEVLQKLDGSEKIWLIVTDEQRHAADIRVKITKQDLSKDDRRAKNGGQRQLKVTKAPEGQVEWDIEIADSEFVMQSLILGRLCRR